MITIDGSQGEGGGQILRTSLALALLTGKSFQLTNIRARRSKPGLQPQHLMSVRAAATVGQAAVQGAALYSSELVFEPGAVRAGKYHFAIGTAGAVGLVLHTIYLPLALRGGEPTEILLEGGTHVNASPCFHFLQLTWAGYLELLGLHLKLSLRRPGFYPRGGGCMEVHIQPCSQLQRLDLRERSRIKTISGFSAVAGLPENIGMRQARRAMNRLQSMGKKVRISQETWAGGPGTVLALVLETAPVPTLFFGLGAKGKPAERVADEAADQALAYLDEEPAAVDSYSADQLVLPLALAQGASEFTVSKVTNHLLTNIAVIRLFIERDIVCLGELGGSGSVRIR